MNDTARFAYGSLLGREVGLEDGRKARIMTRRVETGWGSLARLPEVVAEFSPGRRVALAADANTYRAAGEECRELLEKHGYQVHVALLQPGPTGVVQGDEQGVAQLEGLLPVEWDALLGVGAGTINDLCKTCASRGGGKPVQSTLPGTGKPVQSTWKPYILVPTATSMNGFTSNIAALTEHGRKATQKVQPAVAMVADTRILVAAPKEMIIAGLADLLSKPVTNLDWYIASQLWGTPFTRKPLELLETLKDFCAESAAAIGRGEPAAVEELFQALVMSGISMVVAQDSAAASGGEHLFSHFWDWQSYHAGRKRALHGLQVGLGTLICTTLHECLWQAEHWEPDWKNLEPWHAAGFPQRADLQPIFGAMTDDMERELAAKTLPWPEQRRKLETLAEQWSAFRVKAQEFLWSSSWLKTVFSAAGIPTRAADLGLSATQVREAFLYGRALRRKYTVLDLAHDLDSLEKCAAAVLEESGVL